MSPAETAAVIGSAATLATAGATLWLSLLTRATARASERAVELTGLQMREAHRPVLVPGALDAERLVVPLHNIGLGPALRVRATAHVDRTERVGEPRPWRRVAGYQVLPGVAAGAIGEVPFQASALELPRLRRLDVDFDDVTGHGYRVMADWNGPKRSFGPVMVVDRPALPLELIPPARRGLRRWRRRRASS
jgi:hypothetical protein